MPVEKALMITTWWWTARSICQDNSAHRMSLRSQEASRPVKYKIQLSPKLIPPTLTSSSPLERKNLRMQCFWAKKFPRWLKPAHLTKVLMGPAVFSKISFQSQLELKILHKKWIRAEKLHTTSISSLGKKKVSRTRPCKMRQLKNKAIKATKLVEEATPHLQTHTAGHPHPTRTRMRKMTQRCRTTIVRQGIISRCLFPSFKDSSQSRIMSKLFSRRSIKKQHSLCSM